MLERTESVAEVAVIAVPDSRWGERPLAVVVSTPNATVTCDELNTALADAIGSGQIRRNSSLGHKQEADY